MRAALLLLALAACGSGSTPYGDDVPGDDGYNDGYCHSDEVCAPNVCSRAGDCLPASALRSVTVKWTVNSGPANATTCTPQPDLYLEFDSDLGSFDALGYSPVPCKAGQFFVDKLPKRYQEIALCTNNSACVWAVISADGVAQADLVL